MINKDISNSLLSIGKYTLQLQVHQRVSKFPQWKEGQLILALGGNLGASINFCKPVGVNPLFIRTSYLLLNKLLGRVPMCYPGQPRKRYAEKPQPIIDIGVFLDDNRLRRYNMEMQLPWGDGFQTVRLGKEAKYFGSGPGHLHRHG